MPVINVSTQDEAIVAMDEVRKYLRGRSDTGQRSVRDAHRTAQGLSNMIRRLSVLEDEQPPLDDEDVDEFEGEDEGDGEGD